MVLALAYLNSFNCVCKFYEELIKGKASSSSEYETPLYLQGIKTKGKLFSIKHGLEILKAAVDTVQVVHQLYSDQAEKHTQTRSINYLVIEQAVTGKKNKKTTNKTTVKQKNQMFALTCRAGLCSV